MAIYISEKARGRFGNKKQRMEKMKKEYKNINGLKVEFRRRTCFGDVWHAAGWIGGEYYSRESVFFGYGKKEIRRLIRLDLLKLANG